MSCWASPDVISLVAAIVALAISEVLALAPFEKYNGILQVVRDFALGVMRSKPANAPLASAE